MSQYDPILTNLDNCLYYDDHGNVVFRVGLDGNSINISGPVTIPGIVEIQKRTVIK
jgi:hypothetical protein